MKLATLFSGIGAPEQGAKRVYGDALELVFACEWDKYARESFNANYKIAPEHFHKDINELDGTQYQGEVDCIVGGSPCQDFPDSFKFVVSDTQLYKQAGNSMTVAVLEMIFRQLSCDDVRGDLFDFLD